MNKNRLLFIKTLHLIVFSFFVFRLSKGKNMKETSFENQTKRGYKKECQLKLGTHLNSFTTLLFCLWKRGGLTLFNLRFFRFFYSEESAVGNLSPSPQHWADSAQKTAAILVDMTEYLAVWIPKKMTWGDLCAVASAAADLLDWLADRNAWVEQKKTDRKKKICQNKA